MMALPGRLSWSTLGTGVSSQRPVTCSCQPSFLFSRQYHNTLHYDVSFRDLYDHYGFYHCCVIATTCVNQVSVYRPLRGQRARRSAVSWNEHKAGSSI
ncbi:hypothetical protein BDR07DRAFT_1391694 [Suillus spraguei]|nr:hypothetical protein BDR07DRAFT_1391694 [Suillus spraguei]